MDFFDNVSLVLHQIKVKLFPNYLQKGDGLYVARANNYASLNVEEVCSALKKRGGFTGNLKELIEHVGQYFDEVAYQLCEGYEVNTGYFAIQPKIGGTFRSKTEVLDPKKHRIGFSFRALPVLRRLTEAIALEVDGLGGELGWIDEFTDVEEGLANSGFIPGDTFCITGHKIKVAGDDDSCGVFFVPVENPSKAVKVKALAVNTPTKLVGKAPDTEHAYNTLEIRTRFNGSSGTFLKEPRVIKSTFPLEVI